VPARFVIVSATATAIDYATVDAMARVLGLYFPLATFLGCAVGAVVAFLGARYWAFADSRSALFTQAWRYVFVSGTSALLNAGGVALLLLIPGVEDRIAWISARVLVFAAYNYPLFRGWAFKSDGAAVPSSATLHGSR
jgi:putative flippase GtrA